VSIDRGVPRGEQGDADTVRDRLERLVSGPYLGGDPGRSSRSLVHREPEVAERSRARGESQERLVEQLFEPDPPPTG
jgi:hypothetical protein